MTHGPMTTAQVVHAAASRALQIAALRRAADALVEVLGLQLFDETGTPMTGAPMTGHDREAIYAMRDALERAARRVRDAQDAMTRAHMEGTRPSYGREG